MHGGLPLLGISVLVYGAVGTVVVLRDGARRCRSAWGIRRRGWSSERGGRGSGRCAAV